MRRASGFDRLLLDGGDITRIFSAAASARVYEKSNRPPTGVMAPAPYIGVTESTLSEPEKTSVPPAQSQTTSRIPLGCRKRSHGVNQLVEDSRLPDRQRCC